MTGLSYETQKRIGGGELLAWRGLAGDLALWLVLLGLLVCSRVVLVLVYREQMGADAGFSELYRCFSTGLRYDISAATYSVLPTVVLSLVGLFKGMGRWPERLRMGLVALAPSLYFVLLAVDIGYFAEYGDQFDQWIFGLLYDDRSAIWATVWKSYPVVWISILMVVGILGLVWGVRWLVLRGMAFGGCLGNRGSVWVRAVVVVLATGLVVLGIRGSLGRRPVQKKDAATTGDVFLNKMVVNPLYALRYAIDEHRLLQSEKGLEAFLRQSQLRAAAADLFPGAADHSTLDQSLERVVAAGVGSRPKHIFLLVMESYDSWAMQPEYESLHLTDGMKGLGERGIWVKSFLPASHGTMKSFGAVVTGLPYAGVYVNYQAGLRGGLVTSTATIFERLGYRSRFFYTGYLSWQRIGDFCREQGFDEVYGGDQMAEELTGNEWGVDDATLFDFILSRTGDEPTFNVVLTTSYHPPFSVDVEGEGFDLAGLRENPLCAGLTDERLKVLGHLWYSDRSVTNFVFQAEQTLGESLFAITGDHYSRRALASRPTLYQRTSVPLVLYGPALGRVVRPPALAGSHVDMVPTLVELVAPQGFAYASFGRNILDPGELSPVGLGCEAVIGPDFILSATDPGSMQTWDGDPVQSEVHGEALARRYRQLHGLSWWRSMMGADFPLAP